LSEKGARVVCLEQGDWVDRARLPKAHVDWEVRGRRFWAANPNVRRWPADYPVSSEGEDPVDVYMYNAVGGSQVGFAGNYWRMAPSDFRVHTLDSVGVDWPLDYEELAPYYSINDAEVGIAGLAGDPCGPPRDPLPNPPAPIGRPGALLVDAYEKLGWYWWPTEQSITTHAYRGRPACSNRGWCTFGCPQGSLSTADLTYWPGALENGVELRTNARVREIVIGPDGRGSRRALLRRHRCVERGPCSCDSRRVRWAGDTASSPPVVIPFSPGGTLQLQRPRRQEPDGARAEFCERSLRRAGGRAGTGPGAAPSRRASSTRQTRRGITSAASS